MFSSVRIVIEQEILIFFFFFFLQIKRFFLVILNLVNSKITFDHRKLIVDLESTSKNMLINRQK